MIPIRVFTNVEDLLAHNAAIRKRNQPPPTPMPIHLMRPAPAPEPVAVVEDRPGMRPTLRAICDAAAERHGTTTAAIMSRSKRFIVILARQEAIYHFSRQTYVTQTRIGKLFGGVDHSTVAYSIMRHECRLALGMMDMPKGTGNPGLAFRNERQRRLKEHIFRLHAAQKTDEEIGLALHIFPREVRKALARAGHAIEAAPRKSDQ